MHRTFPYLQRRGFGLTFRIAVPVGLRALVGSREITRAIPAHLTSREAIPLALNYAAYAKSLFLELKVAMSNSGDDGESWPKLDPAKLRKHMDEARARNDIHELKDQHFEELCDLKKQHFRELEAAKLHAKLEAKDEALATALAKLGGASVPTARISLAAGSIARMAAVAAVPAVPAVPATPVPTLSDVVAKFLSAPARKASLPMLKKHKNVLGLFLELIGDKPIDQLDQDDINEFFETLVYLPPRWAQACRKKGLGVKELAALEHETTLGPKSFDDTYLASVRIFLKEARRNWQTKGLATASKNQ